MARFFFRTCEHWAFDNFIIFCILINSAMLAFQNPNGEDPDSVRPRFLSCAFRTPPIMVKRRACGLAQVQDDDVHGDLFHGRLHWRDGLQGTTLPHPCHLTPSFGFRFSARMTSGYDSRLASPDIVARCMSDYGLRILDSWIEVVRVLVYGLPEAQTRRSDADRPIRRESIFDDLTRMPAGMLDRWDALQRTDDAKEETDDEWRWDKPHWSAFGIQGKGKQDIIKEADPNDSLPIAPRYLDDAWNRLDFLIVIAGALTYLPGMGNLTVRFCVVLRERILTLRLSPPPPTSPSPMQVIRAIRVFRPLRSFSHIPEMRVLIDSLAASAAPMATVIVLCGFCFLVFALVGQQLFAGALTQVTGQSDQRGSTGPLGLTALFALPPAAVYARRLSPPSTHARQLHDTDHGPALRWHLLLPNGLGVPDKRLEASGDHEPRCDDLGRPGGRLCEPISRSGQL